MVKRAHLTGLTVCVTFALLASKLHAGDEDFRKHAPPPRAASTFHGPKVQEARLANGTRVLIVERHELPLIAVRVVSDIGAASAPPGVASLAAQVAINGVSGATFLDGERERTSGMRIDAHAGPVSAQIEAKVLATRFNEAVEYLGDIAVRPAWEKDGFAIAKNQQLERRRRGMSSARLAYASVYPSTHPLHEAVSGSEAAVAGASLEQLQAYWRAAFSVGHVTLIVVGDVIPAATLTLVESAFGSLPAATSAPAVLAPLPAPGVRKSVVVQQYGDAQSDIVVASAAPARNSADYDSMRILDEVLGAGMASRIFASTRDTHGYTYGLSSVLESRSDGGIFFIQGSVERAHTGEAVAAILVELAHVSSEKLADAELARAKDHLIQRIPSTFETADGTAGELAQLVVERLPLDDFEHVPERVRAVTGDQVLATAKLYADPTRAQITVLGNARSVESQLGVLQILPVEVRAP